MASDPLATVREAISLMYQKAWGGLMRSEHLDPPLQDKQGLRHGRPQLLLWRDAEGFHDYEPHSLTVFQPFEKTPPMVREATWQRSADMDSVADRQKRSARELRPLTPTWTVRDAVIDRTAYEAILQPAFSLSVPIAWPWPSDRDSLTTDAGAIGFEFFDLAEPQASIRCKWSVDLPPGWEPIMTWFDQMFVWLTRQLAEK